MRDAASAVKKKVTANWQAYVGFAKSGFARIAAHIKDSSLTVTFVKIAGAPKWLKVMKQAPNEQRS